jgi:hypothetical protein
MAQIRPNKTLSRHSPCKSLIYGKFLAFQEWWDKTTKIRATLGAAGAPLCHWRC